MALRFSEEPTHRLSPREAREFLRVHAEREAKSTAADAPTVEDLAETLGITSEEARSILQEARARTAPPKARPRTPSQQEARVATMILACAGVAMACFFLVAPSPRPAPALRVAPATLVSPPAPTPAFRPLAPTPSQAPTAPAIVPPVALSVVPPPGFFISVDSPGGTFGSSGPTIDDATNYRALSAAGAIAVQRALVATVLDLVQPVPAGKWNGAREFGLSIMLQGGRWTRLVVPLGPNPQGDEVRASLTKIVAAAWPQIVR